MTLGEALDTADKHAFPVRLAINRRDKALDQEKGALASLGPRVDLAGNFSEQKQEFSGFSTGSGTGNGTGTSNFGPSGWQAYKSVTLSLSQAVDINGLASKGARGLKYQRQAEDANIETERSALHADVRNKYLSLLQAIELEKVQVEALVAANERLAKANIKLKEGAIPRFEVLKLEAEVKKTEQDLVNAQGTVALARQDLNNTMGIPIETVFEPVPVDIIPVPSGTPDVLVSAALSNRSELLQSQLLVKALEMNAIVATQDIKPALNLTAVHTQYFDTPAGSQQQFDQVNAKLSGPLYDSGAGRRKVRAAERDVEQAKIQQEQIALAVALSVRNAMTNAFTALANRDLAQKNVDLAKEALRIAQLRYDEGAGILLDVIVAQADYTSARANLVNANYRYLQAFAQLQRAVGSDDLRARPTTNTQEIKK